MRSLALQRRSPVYVLHGWALEAGTGLCGQSLLRKDGGKQRGARLTDHGVAPAKGAPVSGLKELIRKSNP